MDLRRSACLYILLAALLISGPVPEMGPAGAGPAMAAKLKVPRFVSLRFDTVNLRAGPGTQYPIDWVYKRRGLPVEVIRDLDTWRQVRDRWGTVGWIHLSNLSGRRTVLIDPANRHSAQAAGRPGKSRRESGTRRDRQTGEMRRRLVPDRRRRPYRLGPPRRGLGRPREGRRRVRPAGR